MGMETRHFEKSEPAAPLLDESKQEDFMGTRRTCPRCGAKNPIDAYYCTQCGVLLRDK